MDRANGDQVRVTWEIELAREMGPPIVRRAAQTNVTGSTSLHSFFRVGDFEYSLR